MKISEKIIKDKIFTGNNDFAVKCLEGIMDTFMKESAWQGWVASVQATCDLTGSGYSESLEREAFELWWNEEVTE